MLMKRINKRDFEASSTNATGFFTIRNMLHNMVIPRITAKNNFNFCFLFSSLKNRKKYKFDVRKMIEMIRKNSSILQNSFTRFTFPNRLFQSRQPRLLLFRSHNPVKHYFFVGWSLVVEKFPSFFVGFKLFFKFRVEN